MAKSSLRLNDILNPQDGPMQVIVSLSSMYEYLDKMGELDKFDFVEEVGGLRESLQLSSGSSGIEENYDLKRSGSPDAKQYYVSFTNQRDAYNFMRAVKNLQSGMFSDASISKVPLGIIRYQLLKQLPSLLPQASPFRNYFLKHAEYWQKLNK